MLLEHRGPTRGFAPPRGTEGTPHLLPRRPLPPSVRGRVPLLLREKVDRWVPRAPLTRATAWQETRGPRTPPATTLPASTGSPGPCKRHWSSPLSTGRLSGRRGKSLDGRYAALPVPRARLRPTGEASRLPSIRPAPTCFR